MEFLLVAYDGTDAQAPERRLNAREAHLQRAMEAKEAGNLIHGGAILDDQGKMIGSTLYLNFPDRETLENWLKDDPYVKQQVWDKVEVKPVKLLKFS
ncbi:YciI family protein [Rapidithrix thailandica]|uniref:YciI family protein n=1 Tax=Rapidithrix thailandica TaxID=413964 RepID=A0AAW9S7W7_9BACT